MKLDEEAEAMRAGAFGAARRWAIEHQIRVGRFFDAEDLVPVRQAHVMADSESLGLAGTAFLEGLASQAPGDRRVRVPTITDPRGVDFAAYRRLGIDESLAQLERRAVAAFEALGVLMTDTCINYQTILPPTRGETMAFGDTGVVIYANSVCGARSNFEGGPSALAAGLTGRTPRYGYHLDRHRRGTRRFVLGRAPRSLSDWGALGGVVGRATNDYWQVPVIEGVEDHPGSDALKHFGAALASFGSVAMFHMPGVTPEAATAREAFDGSMPEPVRIGEAEFARFYAGYAAPGGRVDVVVFAAPQLSLLEMQRLADLLDGRRVAGHVTLLAATSPEIRAASDRMGISARIAAAGGIVLEGVCFYQSYAREMAEANGWRRLLTNSAKLVNIIAGYGYEPSLGTAEYCVDCAVAGRMP